MNKAEDLGVISSDQTPGTKASGKSKPASGITLNINLDKPLRWKGANADESKLLENLQGNILKGHGRDRTWNIFFEFQESNPSKARRALREIGNRFVTNAHSQLLKAENFKKDKEDGGSFCGLAISSSGYKALGMTFPDVKENSAFNIGMRNEDHGKLLADPEVNTWDAAFQKNLHGIILVGDDDVARGSRLVMLITDILAEGTAVVHHIQQGRAIRNQADEGLEHFGYVDGRSQPLMLMEDIDHESELDGTVHWDPAFPLSTVLVPDPFAKNSRLEDRNQPDPLAFGSFFVFRKLEQNVRDFKKKEQLLADTLNLHSEDRERAGALIVGRFEDGTPVTLSPEAMNAEIVRNDFSYLGDNLGARCPFHAHIRKTNPRNSGGFKGTEPERSHIMARRGITYEDTARVVHPEGLPGSSTTKEFEKKIERHLPVDGVGLLFMAYNARLDKQFVFTQVTWANNPAFPKPDPATLVPGIDPVIGQTRSLGPNKQTYAKDWDNIAAGTVEFDMQTSIVMKGGEYFFAPSLAFLQNL